MDLTTRCPQCGSTFQASLDQLQLRKGYIRCIHCAHIFDGYEAVVPAAGVPAGASASDASSADRDAPVKGPRIVRPRLTEGAHETAAWPEVRIPKFTISSGTPGNPESLEEPVISARPPVDHAHRITPRAEPVIGAGRSIPTAARRPDQQAASEPVYVPDAAVGASSQVYAEPREARYSGDQQSLPEFLDKQFTRRRGAARVFWSVLVLIGLCAILAQVVYVYRVAIASNVPVLRPVLEQACQALHCQVPYPRRIELISIMGSSLQAAPAPQNAPKDESHMRLQVTLRNNFEKPQEWPTLTLDLVEFSGAVVVKKILAPKDYLSAGALHEPFAAKSEIRITVPVTVTGFKINGYQLGKFFP